MASGGPRPGAGRKKGQKDTRPRKGSPAHEEAEKIKQMLAMGIRAKARFYQEFLLRVSKGEKLSLAEKRLMDKLSIELAAELNEEKTEEPTEKLDPLDYMLKVMNDPNEEKEMRARMAIAAAPFVHARPGDSKGKKQEKDDKAKVAGSGKYASMSSRLKVVK